MSESPSFAQQWVQPWKQAGRRLQAIRDEEMRRLSNKSGKVVEEVCIYEKHPLEHGMVAMQRWLMRNELLSRLSKRDEVK